MQRSGEFRADDREIGAVEIIDDHDDKEHHGHEKSSFAWRLGHDRCLPSTKGSLVIVFDGRIYVFGQASCKRLPALAVLAVPFCLTAQSPTAPTATNSAESLADAWVQASAKYDSPRKAILADVERGSQDGRFRPDWNSLSQYQVPNWYRDAKFGIFIHWGVYSVPAFGSEWYPRQMYLAGSKENEHQVSLYGPLTKFGYKDFVPMFKAQHFDPQAWARLFKESGARYVVPVFEHHDGFQMYDSQLSDWTAAKMGPHRDLMGDLEKQVRAEGLYFGASSHRIEHDWFMDGGRKVASDVNDPQYAAFYGPAQIQLQDKTQEHNSNLDEDWTYVSPAYANDWLARNAEIVQKYHPDIIFFDWWIGQPYVRPYLTKFAAYYYNESAKRGPVGIITFKWVTCRRIRACSISNAASSTNRSTGFGRPILR